MTQRAILYYTHNSLPIEMEQFFQQSLIANAGDIPVVSSMSKQRSHYSQTFASHNLVGEGPVRGCWANILAHMKNGLQTIIQRYGNAVVYLAEHDVLYSPNYFDLVPPDDRTIVKNLNLYMMNRDGFFGPHNAWIHSQTIAHARLLLDCIEETCEPAKRFKTQIGYRLLNATSSQCCVDVRHSYNYTGYREPSSKKYLHELPYWGDHAGLSERIPYFAAVSSST